MMLFAILALAACAPAVDERPVVEPGPSLEADVAAIEQYFRDEVAAVAAGDLETWLAGFTDDIVLMPPNQPTASGMDAVRAWGEPLFGGFDMVETQSLGEIEIAGDWAFAIMDYTFQATPKEGGETATESGRLMWIMERQPTGAWKAARIIWNSDTPLTET